MELLVEPSGTIRCVYSEELELQALGQLALARASHVEPDAEGQWLADLSPVLGPVLGPFPLRKQALAAEVTWIERNWLMAERPTSSDQQHS